MRPCSQTLLHFVDLRKGPHVAAEYFDGASLTIDTLTKEKHNKFRKFHYNGSQDKLRRVPRDMLHGGVRYFEEGPKAFRMVVRSFQRSQRQDVSW